MNRNSKLHTLQIRHVAYWSGGRGKKYHSCERPRSTVLQHFADPQENSLNSAEGSSGFVTVE